MKKKILPLFLVFIISFSIFTFHPGAAHAAIIEGTAARVLEDTVGERVLAAVAEKAGVKYLTKTARKEAVKRWNLEMYQAINDAKAAGTDTTVLENTAKGFANYTDANVIPLPDKPGFGKVMVDATLFLTGADLLVSGANAIYNASQAQTMISVASEYSDAIKAGQLVTSVYGAQSYYADGYLQFGFVDYADPFGHPTSAIMFDSVVQKTMMNFADITAYSLVNGVITVSGVWHYNTVGTKDFTNLSFGIPNWITSVPDFRTDSFVPDASTTPEINLTPWAQELANTGQTTQTVPNQVPVEIPLTSGYPEQITTPWNDPVPDLGTDPVPDPPPDPQPAPGLDFSKIKESLGQFTGAFPFSIPWDFARLLSVLNVNPETPKFDIKADKTVKMLGVSIPVNYDFTIDFSPFDAVAMIGRWALVLIFDVAIILALRRLTPD